MTVVTLVFALLISLLPLSASAQSAKVRIPGGGSMTISARNSDRDFEKGTMTLTGGVQVIYGLQYLSCDQAIINEKTQEIEAVGNLVISSPMAYVEGDRALLNYKTNTGIIYNGFVKSGQVVFEGKIIHKLGDELYDAEQANFTACTTCPSAWTFKGSRIRAELGGYAHITNSILDVAGLPVFYLPYLVVPLKSERQTGLLMPLISFSGDGGPALGLSYFWAISRSQDATFTETYYSKRGPKEAFNYEYMLSPTSQGQLSMGTVHDAVFASDGVIFPNHNGDKKIDRWFLTSQHTFELPFNVTQRANFNFVSDLRYPRDFPDEMSGQGDPALENRVSLWHNTETTHASLDVDYYINQMHADPVQPNDDAVHRWPALNYSIVDHEIGHTGILFRMSNDYVNFTREGFAWDDVQKTADGHYQLDPNRTGPGANVFDPNVDAIRTGQRFDVQPEISYPFHIGSFIDVLPQLQFRHTQYIFNIEPPADTAFNNTPYKEYERAILNFRTVFSHVYGPRQLPPTLTAAPSLDLGSAGKPLPPSQSNWSDLESQGVIAPVHPTLYRHEIQPELILSGLRQQLSKTPFFKADAQQPIFLADQPVSDVDFYNNDSLQFDYFDRVYERNAATLGLENKLIRKRWIGETPEYKQVARVRLAQSYDFDEARAPRGDGKRFPWSDLSMLTDLRLDGFETYTLLQYFPYHGVTNTSSRARVLNNRGDFLEVNFTQTYAINLDLGTAYPGRTENLGFGVGVDRKYFTLLTALNLDPTLASDKVGHVYSFNTTDRFNTDKTGVKGFTTDLIIKPPGNCWGLHATIVQNIGDKPQWHLNFEYKFGGETQPAPLPTNAPSPGQMPAKS